MNIRIIVKKNASGEQSQHMQLKKSFGERAKSIIGGGNKPGKQIDIDTNEDTFFSFLCKCE